MSGYSSTTHVCSIPRRIYGCCRIRCRRYLVSFVCHQNDVFRACNCIYYILIITGDVLLSWWHRNVRRAGSSVRTCRSRSVWNVMAHAQKQDFVFRRNGRIHLNRRGRQFSGLLAAEVCTSAVLMLDTPCSEVVWRVLATSPISPSLPLPCVTVCYHISTGLYALCAGRLFVVESMPKEGSSPM
jgi:hypothetical protein